MHSATRPARTALGRIAARLGILVVFLGGPAFAADTGNGSKNFRTPSSVPNYFSNEAGPMLGPASETQRGQLYTSRAASAPAPQDSAPAAAPRPRQHIAMAVPHGRAARGRHAAPVYAHHVAVRGHIASHAVAHGTARGHSVHSVRATHPVSKPTRVAHRGRG